MCIDTVAGISNALLTPLIAIVATYIAWQQWQTNRQKLVLERYDRRLRVYEEVRKILSIIMSDANATVEQLLQFRTSVSEADFLFGPEITEYIDEIYRRGVQLRYWNGEYRDCYQAKTDDYDHSKVTTAMHTELTWLTSQFEPAKLKFKKYLDIST